MPTPIKRIAIFPKIQPDTAAAVFLLKRFGEALFPGIADAEVVFWSATEPGKTAETYEKEGTLLIDLAGSRFDHHRDDHGKKTDCASGMVAKFLGVSENPELRKLLAWAKRDDLDGKGTLSEDPLDRAFGMSGIIMTLNRTYTDNPKSVLDFTMAVIAAHVHDEWRRAVELPAEWRKIKSSGKAGEATMPSALGTLRVFALESANTALPGFLRAYMQADIVIQRLPTGHTNIVTRQQRRVDLREVAAKLRLKEAQQKGILIEHLSLDLHQKPGRLDGVEEWFYDTAANTIQNGGVNPQGITPTRLTLVAIAACVREGLAPPPKPQP